MHLNRVHLKNFLKDYKEQKINNSEIINTFWLSEVCEFINCGNGKEKYNY